MATIYQNYGDKVRKLRKQRGLSQEQLAELIRRDPRTIVAIESGKRNPTLNTVHKIARALKTSLSELLSF